MPYRNFTTTRMGTISGIADAYQYDPNATNGAHEIFQEPVLEPQDWWQGTAAAWPKASLTSTTPEQVREQAELQEKQREDKLDELPPLASLDDDWPELPIEGVADAAPRPMSFFAGRTYAAGREAYNAHCISRGLPPMPEGKR